MNASLGLKIQIIAKTRGLSQTDLANKIGVNKSSISNFFNGKHDLNTTSFIKLLELLDIHIYNMIERNLDLALERTNIGSPGDMLDELLDIIPSKLKKKNIIKSISNLAKEYESKGQKPKQIYNNLKNYTY